MRGFFEAGLMIAATGMVASCASPSTRPKASCPEPAAAAPAAKGLADPERTIKAGLAAKQVRDVVMANLRPIRACYETEAKRSPALKGAVTADWVIAASGVVSRARIVESTLGNAAVEACIVHVIEGWRFPSSEAPTFIACFPFKFGLGPGEG